MPRLARSWQAVYRSYPDSVRVNLLSEPAEALYLRLVVLSDDFGRYHGTAHEVLGKALTRRWQAGQVDVAGVEEMLVEMERAGLARRYEAPGGEVILELLDYLDPTQESRKKQVFPLPGPDCPPVAPNGCHTVPLNPNPRRTPDRQMGPSGGPPDEDREAPPSLTEQARDLLFGPGGLLAAGLAQNVIPEALTQLASSRWLGGHTQEECAARLAHVAAVAGEATNPGGFILEVLRRDQASNTVPIKLEQPKPDGPDGGNPRYQRWEGSDDPERTAHRFRLQADASTKEAARLREVAVLHEQEGHAEAAAGKRAQADKLDQVVEHLLERAEALDPTA